MLRLCKIAVMIFAFFALVGWIGSGVGTNTSTRLAITNLDAGPPSTDALLLETGDYLLLESGDKLLLE